MDPIERHIKQHFDQKSYPYNEAHWLEVQKLIAEDKRKRRGWLFWWTGAVSALLLAVFAYWSVSADSVIVSDITSGKTSGTEYADFSSSISETDQSGSENAGINSGNNSASNMDAAGISSTNDQFLLDGNEDSHKKNKSAQLREFRQTNGITGTTRAAEKFSNSELMHQEPTGNSSDQISDILTPNETTGTVTIESNQQHLSITDESIHDNLLLVFKNELKSESKELEMGVIDLETAENSVNLAELAPITPAKGFRFGWGFVAGYLMQKQFTEDQWLNGAYFGARASWFLSPKWSISTDISGVVQEIKAVHFHHDALSGYGFGRDSLVTDMYAKRAIALQIPVSVSYTIGRHIFSGTIGTRILLDAQARMQKLHYTNPDPDNVGNPSLLSRSRMVSDKEQIMPEGTVAPFSIYTGIKYGWMIGKGWGIETSFSMPVYHALAPHDIGTKLAADQGIRLEIGVLKVF